MNLQIALQLLNIKAGCSLEDVKQAYRKAALQTHPDKGGSTEKYIQVKEAYDYLNKFGTNKREQLRQTHFGFRVYNVRTTTNVTVNVTYTVYDSKGNKVSVDVL